MEFSLLQQTALRGTHAPSRALHKNSEKHRHSGAPRSGEPGIHEHQPLEYGFRVPSLRSGPGMTGLLVQSRLRGRHRAGKCCAVMHDAATVIETDVPARLDRLPWTRFHTLVVVALGITWVLD